MTLARPDIEDGVFVLTTDELHLLRFTCDVSTADESPLGRLVPILDSGVLEQAARSLIARGLADRGTFRPERELSRRLLIISQPDARIVLMDAGPTGGDRVLDVYERAGAYAPYRAIADGHELWEPQELEVITQRVLRRFRPRVSMGDFFDFTLSTTEYFAFSILAGDLSRRRRRAASRGDAKQSGRIRVQEPRGRAPKRRISQSEIEGPGAPISGVFHDEGTPIHGLLRRMPAELSNDPRVPDEAAWNRALDALEAKDIITRSADLYALRPALHDLALGLSTQRRSVLTRFDFGADDWIARDATFIDVPGSLFVVRALKEQAIRIIELDVAGLEAATRQVLDPLGDSAED